MSRLALILLAAIMATGCGQTLERMQRKAAAKDIVERTITKPQIVYVDKEVYIRLPEALLKPCQITYKKNFKVEEYVRVADTNTLYLSECKSQIDEIIKLQPVK